MSVRVSFFRFGVGCIGRDMVVVVAIMSSETNVASEQSRARSRMYVFRERRQILMALIGAAAEQSLPSRR